MNNIRLQQMGAQNQMQRDGSEVDMNGAPRGQSPMPGDNAPSPKRQRVDSGNFNPQMLPNGRPQGMGGQQPNGNAPNATMLMAAGFDPQNAMSPNFNQANGLPKNAAQLSYSQEMANQAKNAMHGMPKGPMSLAGMPHNSPMLTAGPEGQLIPADFLNNNGAAMRGANSMGATGNGGALADYQMQLMLLEQQNKKRLMMARQEQDVAQRDQGGMGPSGLMGQPGFAPPMSPRASRAGHSPASNDPAKRGTPKMGQDSPLPDVGMRNSPGPGNFEPGQMQGGMLPFTMVGGPNGMMVRPQHPGQGPIPQQLEMMRQQQNIQRMANGGGAWPPGMQNPGQMMPPGQGIMQPNPMDANMPRNNMAPPQGPANGRTQPPSPQQQNAAPPTPSQNNKAGPKKKDAKDKPKVRPALQPPNGFVLIMIQNPKKKASTTTGATPSEAEPVDEVPPTPITPKSKLASVIKGPTPQQPTMNMPQQQQQQQQPQPMPPSAAMNMGMPQDNPMGPFSALNDSNVSTTLLLLPSGATILTIFQDMPNFEFDDILGQDNTDVLHGFDFDAFLHNEPVPGFDFDAPYLNGDTTLDAMGE